MPPILEMQRAELEVTEAEFGEKEGEASKLQVPTLENPLFLLSAPADCVACVTFKYRRRSRSRPRLYFEVLNRVFS